MNASEPIASPGYPASSVPYFFLLIPLIAPAVMAIVYMIAAACSKRRSTQQISQLTIPAPVESSKVPVPAAKKKSAWKKKTTFVVLPSQLTINNLPLHENLGTCVVCLDRTANVAFVACHHVCICQECSLKYVNRQCPTCRQEGDRFNLIYT